MALIALASYICLIILLGLVTTSLLFPAARLRVGEWSGLAILCGIGSLGFVLFWLSLLSILPNRQAIGPILVASVIAVLMLRQKRRAVHILPLARPQLNWHGATLIIPAGAIAFCIVAMVVNALAYPLYEWDAFAIWFLKAKILLHEPLWPQPAYFHDRAMSYSHRDYPLMQPMFIAGLWGWMGSAQDRWGKLALVLPYVGMALIFFAEARRRLSSLAAGWLTAVFVCAPALPFWTPSGDADVMVAAFYTAHLVYLVRWLSTRDRGNLLAAGFFACCMWFTKHEGQVLALISAAIVLVIVPIKERRFDRRILLYPAMLVLLLLPWHVWSWNLPHSNQRFPEHITPSVLAENLPALGTALKLLAAEFTRWQSWGLLFPLLAVCALLTLRRLSRTDTLAVWLIFLGQLGFLAMAYVLALPNMKSEMAAGMRRLFVQVIPAVAMLIVLHWPEVRNPNDQVLMTNE